MVVVPLIVPALCVIVPAPVVEMEVVAPPPIFCCRVTNPALVEARVTVPAPVTVTAPDSVSAPDVLRLTTAAPPVTVPVSRVPPAVTVRFLVPSVMV